MGQVKIDKHPPKLLTPQELDSIYAQVQDPKLMATFKTLEVTGMRVGEIKNSRRDGGYIVIYKSKGRKERFVPIKEEHISDYELTKETGYSDSWISHSFSRFVKRCGISEKKTLHSLRHTYAYRKLIEMGNIQLVRDLLGHSSVVVTEIYTQMPQEYLKQILESNAVKILGITVEPSLKFNVHDKTILNNAGKKLTILARMANILSFSKMKLLIKSSF